LRFGGILEDMREPARDFREEREAVTVRRFGQFAGRFV
jgi:hypothetical protein